MKTTATQFSAKTVFTSSGKMLNSPLACVKPIPMLSESEEIIRFLWLNPHFAVIPNPAKRMEPNIIMVQPPRTA